MATTFEFDFEDLSDLRGRMQSGADVIFQAGLSDDTWSGWADFLNKVDNPILSTLFNPCRLGSCRFALALVKVAAQSFHFFL